MAVLRCPYCGEKVKQGDRFCSHCGEEFDKPHVDELDTAFQETGRSMVKVFAVVVLWFVLLILMGFVTYSVLGIQDNHMLSFVLSIVLTAVIVLLFKK